MATCRICGGYASEGKDMCPWDQIRHGELVKGKWVVDASAATTKELRPEKPGEQTTLDLGEN